MDVSLENYKLVVDIFKGYLDTALTIHTSYYALTGAITAYYLANRKERPYIKYALLLPLLLGAALAFVAYNGTYQALTLQDKVDQVVAKLTMPGAPPVDILRQSLFILMGLDIVIFLSLIVLFFWPKNIFERAVETPPVAVPALTAVPPPAATPALPAGTVTGVGTTSPAGTASAVPVPAAGTNTTPV